MNKCKPVLNCKYCQYIVNIQKSNVVSLKIYQNLFWTLIQLTKFIWKNKLPRTAKKTEKEKYERWAATRKEVLYNKTIVIVKIGTSTKINGIDCRVQV